MLYCTMWGSIARLARPVSLFDLIFFLVFLPEFCEFFLGVVYNVIFILEDVRFARSLFIYFFQVVFQGGPVRADRFTWEEQRCS